MEELLQRFRAGRAALLRVTGKRPNRYPDELRQIAIAYSKTAQMKGMRRKVVAEALGIDAVTLTSWELPAGEGEKEKPAAAAVARPRLRRIEVVDAPQGGCALYVVGPRGVRVEGMSVEQVAALFERLSC